MSAEDFKQWLRGAVRSWMIWLGAVAFALPDLLPLISPQLEQLMDANAYKRTIQVLGILVIVLRVKTTTSLKDKA